MAGGDGYFFGPLYSNSSRMAARFESIRPSALRMPIFSERFNPFLSARKRTDGPFGYTRYVPPADQWSNHGEYVVSLSGFAGQLQ